MKTKSLVLLICIFGILSCHKSTEKLRFNNSIYSTSVPIEGSPFMGLPIFFDEIDNNIIISDFYGDSLITIFCTKNNRVKKIAPKGNGPLEFQSPLYTSIKDSLLLVFNKGRFEFGQYSINDLFYEAPVFQKKLDVPTFVSNIYPLNNNLFLASGYFDESRYSILDSTGAIINYFGLFPSFAPEEENYPTSAKAMFHQTFFQKHPKNGVVASISSHVVELIEIEQIPPIVSKSIKIADYNYRYTTGEMQTARLTDKFPKGIISSTSDEDYIYLLFNSSTTESKDKTNEILILDWSLNPVKKIVPDLNYSLITVGEKEGLLGISFNTEPKIYSLSLKTN